MEPYLKIVLRKYQRSVLAALILTSMGLLIPLYPYDIITIGGIELVGSSFITAYITFSGMVLISTFLNAYLSSPEDEKNYKESLIQDINSDNASTREHAAKLISKSERRMEGELESLRKSIESMWEATRRNAGDSLTDHQTEELVSTLKEQLLASSSEELLEDLREKTNRVLERRTSERLSIHFDKTIRRLSTEIQSLEKRSRVNLIIGSLTAFAGVSIFILFIFGSATDSTAQSFLATEFAPRISLVIVIELFAYFFLGLYKSNLSEIKHFHNEVTNIEQKHMALEEALASADKDTVKNIVLNFSNTERNFLLRKGESTVALEEKRVALEKNKGLINALTSKSNDVSK